MKLLLTIIPLLLASTSYSQFINPDFEEWEWIEGIGQPYENPVGWKTNNEQLYTGFANTPVTKEEDSTGFYARIESNFILIDAYGAGEMSQTISARHLEKIAFTSRCESIFQTGRCIVRLSGDQPEDELYVDSMSIPEAEFQLHTILIPTEWTQENDSITLQFIAKGNLDDYDEEVNGHSVFLIDFVKTDYLTNTINANLAIDLNIYPNPSDGMIHFISNPATNYERVVIVSLTGQVMYNDNFSPALDLSH